ncbi:hypothetical protein LZ32DRAFT_610186 [Colletotrichum eremochloae]|nr:hypothetical protein LZ32DRAFT_610186 [Colletotrichum eremochloae]
MSSPPRASPRYAEIDAVTYITSSQAVPLFATRYVIVYTRADASCTDRASVFRQGLSCSGLPAPPVKRERPRGSIAQSSLLNSAVQEQAPSRVSPLGVPMKVRIYVLGTERASGRVRNEVGSPWTYPWTRGAPPYSNFPLHHAVVSATGIVPL